MADVNPETVASIANVAISIVPEILALVRSRHVPADPNAPTPTDAEVLAGLQAAVSSSVAKDDRWLAVHPEPPAPPSS